MTSQLLYFATFPGFLKQFIQMYLGLSVCEMQIPPVCPDYSTVVLEISWRHSSRN